MKQLKKIGSQAARVLTDDQMKNVTGGEFLPGSCMPLKPGGACSTLLACSQTDSKGNVWRGTCNSYCFCLLYNDPEQPVIPVL